jgi:hypothetical protein
MHGTQSRFNSDIEMVRAGKLPWYALMQRPPLVLKRDPIPLSIPADTARYLRLIWLNASTTFPD